MRYFAIAIVGVLLLGFAGYLLQDRLFAAPVVESPVPAIARRAAPPAAPVAATAPPAAIVIDVDGNVERRAGADWTPVVSGDRLSLQDTIRTADGAHAHIEVGGTAVELADRSEITVVDISLSVSQISLDEGRVSANAGEPGGPRIRIEARGAGAVAEADTGRFDVISSGEGHAAIAAETGEVKVTAHGADVEVHAGEQAFVHDGAAPSAPIKIPASLFLKVGIASGTAHTAVLRGETTPGAVVNIDGVPSGADAQGHFSSTVAMREGANTIVVFVEDASGRRERKVIRRSLDTRGPDVKTEVTW